MRDLETIRLAIEAAATGHLVFSTLHTSSAAKTVDRVIEVFPEGEQAQIRSTLADSLRAIVSQALFKRIDIKRAALRPWRSSLPPMPCGPDPRRQDPSDPLRHADRQEIRHADSRRRHRRSSAGRQDQRRKRPT